VAEGWSVPAADWADQEEKSAQVYERALDLLAVGSGTRLLDVGCGAGGFCRRAAARGAAVAGLDASETMLAEARRRSNGIAFHRGDLASPPFADDAFDVVTGLNAFQFADDAAAALREAARVAPTVFALVWGDPARNGFGPVLRALAALRSSPPSGGPSLAEPERAMRAAGLEVARAGAWTAAWEYADEEEAMRLLLASPPGLDAARTSGEAAVRAAALRALAPARAPAGGYRIEIEWRWALAVRV
jgi:SAM-dependent methyltransferase